MERVHRVWILPLALVLLVLTSSPLPAQTPNYSDIWWDPAEPGWAIALADHGTQLSGILLGYGAYGIGGWYMIPAGNFSPDKRFFNSATDRSRCFA